MRPIDYEALASRLPSLLAAAAERDAGLPALSLSEFDPAHTALVIVDMVNGFAVSGALASPRVGEMIPSIARVAAACAEAGMPLVAFADTHTPDSIELTHYPPHCLRGSGEELLCEELRSLPITVIEKNSTNGFLEPAFDEWLTAHPQITTYLVVGDCTDICVCQFALTAKAWYETADRPLRVVVPVELVDTFDGAGHDADAMNAAALTLMQAGGVELCHIKEI